MLKNAHLVCRNANPRDYHQTKLERGNPGLVVTSTMLREFAKCPDRWKKGYVGPGSKAQEFGSLLDCLVLTPTLTSERYWTSPEFCFDEDGVQKPWDYKAKNRRKLRDDMIAAGVQTVTFAEHERALTAARSIFSDATLSAYVVASDTQVWLKAEWHDPGTGLVIPVQVMLDLVPRIDSEFAKSLGDLKSTKNAGVPQWKRWCFSAGYHFQAALYEDVYKLAFPGEDRQDWCFVLVENYPPFQPGRRLLSTRFRAIGRLQYQRALRAYAEALHTGIWPSYDDTDVATPQGWTIVEPDEWMENDALTAGRYDHNPEPEPNDEDQDPDADTDTDTDQTDIPGI